MMLENVFFIKNRHDKRQSLARTFCHYDQLIDYTNDKGTIQWIHVSFKRDGKNRKEWLHKKV